MNTAHLASAALEAFIDESIRLSKQSGYHPTVFQRMRADHGTLQAIERLVQSGEMQSGFRRLSELGLTDWSIEAAVLKFAEEFTRTARECSEWRLRQVRQTS